MPTGRCGPCCSTAATGSTAMRARENSSVVSESQSVTYRSVVMPAKAGTQ